MTKMKQRTSLRRAIVTALATLAAVALLASAAVPALALPPRPEDIRPPERRQGGGILLTVSGAVPSCSAVVQWEDGLGAWHDVDGWRGQVEQGSVVWFVSEDVFGTGPYRWVVYDGEGTLGVSQPFEMPTYHGQLLRVEVAVGSEG